MVILIKKQSIYILYHSIRFNRSWIILLYWMESELRWFMLIRKLMLIDGEHLHHHLCNSLLVWAFHWPQQWSIFKPQDPIKYRKLSEGTHSSIYWTLLLVIYALPILFILIQLLVGNRHMAWHVNNLWVLDDRKISYNHRR